MIKSGQLQEAPESSAGRRAARIELDNGVSFSVNEDSLPISIGRDAGCTIRIASGHVSRHHCELFLRDGRLFLRDTSSNGTTVDNRVVRQSSVTIDRRTAVTLANEVKMVLTPFDEGAAETAPRVESGAPRPEDPEAGAFTDRRQGVDRRQRNVVVAFDRRSGIGERRRSENDPDS